MASAIACKVVTPTGVVFDGEVGAINGPGWEGLFGILPHHAPYLVRLVAGRVVLKDGPGGSEIYGLDIGGGFLVIAHDRCTVLVEEVREGTDSSAAAG